MKREIDNKHPIQLIVQYYRSNDPARQEEIDTCLRNNLINSFISTVHLLTEEQFDFSRFPNADKVVQTVVGERLTFEQAFSYANDFDSSGKLIWVLSNADIFFNDTLSFVKRQNLNGVVYALTRHDVQPDGTLKLVPPEFAHGCQDVWIFQTPVQLGKLFTAFYLGVPGCDNRIAFEFVQAGYLLLNPADKIITSHLDLASNIDIYKRTSEFAELMTEESFRSGKAVPSPYQYFLYPSDKLVLSVEALYSETLSLHEQLYNERNLSAEHKEQLVLLGEQLAQKDALLSQKDVLLSQKDAQMYDLRLKLAEREARVNALHNSLSWRITQPLRTFHEKLVPVKYRKPQKPAAKNNMNDYFTQLLMRKCAESTYCRDVMVDIVLPVYNGFDVTNACIDSVLNNSENCRLIIIDDASTDERIQELIRRISSVVEKHLEVILLRNEENLGFVKTVNKGVALTKNHFVILNSDTEVPPGWLDRLFAPILQGHKVATVTPFSNSATICSFPEFCMDNSLYRNLSVATIDSYFNRFGSVSPIDIPSGVGFCMAVNKQLAERIGFFDEKSFTRGYGEENDFCMRAANTGYRNVLAANLFVYHKHGESFGSSERQELMAENYLKLVKRYPDYPRRVDSFVSSDPLRSIRETLALIIAASESKKDLTIAIIDFDLGGGSGLYATNLAHEIISSGKKLVHFKYSLYERCLYIEYADMETMRIAVIEESAGLLDVIMDMLCVDFIMISQLVSWPKPLHIIDSLLKSHIPYLVFIHDLFFVCPKFVLINKDGHFCQIPADGSLCSVCLQQNDLNGLPVDDDPRMKKIDEWRTAISPFLDNASKVVCFSQSTSSLISLAYPALTNIAVNEHFIPHSEIFQWRNRFVPDREQLTIAVIGGINFAKGNEILLDLLQSADFKIMPIKIVVIGEMELKPEKPEEVGDKLIVHGRYDRSALPGLLDHYEVSAVLIPSVCPETFSFTTSEALLMGYPVICLNLGAQAERVKKLGAGIVVAEPFLKGLLEAFRTITEQPELLEQFCKMTKGYVPNSSESHFGVLNKIIAGEL